VGAELAGFPPIAFTALKTYAPPPDHAFGHALVGVGRRGKYLLMDFAAATFVCTSCQGGRVKPTRSSRPSSGLALARWVLADGSALLLTEAGTEKRAGVWVREGDLAALEAQEPIEGLGPDGRTRSTRPSWPRSARPIRCGGTACCATKRAIAGIGRRLANEICHRAKLSPFATRRSFTAEEVASLRAAITSCIDESFGLRAQP